MPDLITSANVDTLLQAADFATFRTSLGLTTLATTAPGANVATFLTTPSSANLLAAITDETGTGALVFGTSPGFTTAANPISNDGASLGTAALNWADLFLASGGVINFNNGNLGLTHNNAGTFLLVNPGDLRITSANVGTNADSVPTLSSTSTLSGKTLASPTLTGTTTASTINADAGTVGALNFSRTLAADDTYHGTGITGINSGYTNAQWDAVYYDFTAGEWLAADANGSGTYPAQGLAVAASTDGAALTVMTQGIVRNDAWAWVAGPIYLSTTAAGLTQTAPSTSGDKVQVVGFALTADVAYFNFNTTYLTVA